MAGRGRSGALALSAIFLAFALLGVPSIVEHPLVYNGTQRCKNGD
jgi:hypothetical protein